ncbi:hypothetical protein IGJ02_000100 [Enterococcus sp. DIV0724b]|uniref:LLM class flavin-dependent oxidoreductase n=1 Tax=Enterococcus sp. DIV0724b TaxID=2774694 RepID=UPI003D3010D3
MRLSILDQLNVSTNSSSIETLHQAEEIALLADNLGYTRIWYSEHHGSDAMASATPEILVAHIASITERIRVGAGGIMMMHYSPLKIAETFKTLSALHPNRIDLGLGRAPGGNQLTTLALNPSMNNNLNLDDKLSEILMFMDDNFPEDHFYSRVSAVPREVIFPKIWLLGSGGASAKQAGLLGINYSFAQFISGPVNKDTLANYYDNFIPSIYQERPETNAAYFTVVADSKEEAEYRSASYQHFVFATERGLPNKFVSPEEALSYPYTEMEKADLEKNRSRFVIGDSKSVADYFRKEEELGVSEAMIIAAGYTIEDRKTTLRLLAKEML